MTKTCKWFELKTRRLEKSGAFILLKACPAGFFHGKTASPKFQFSNPGRRTWGIFNPCNGTSAFRKDTFISHWKSVFHKWCKDKKKLETKSKSDDSTASSSGPLVEVVKKMEHGLQEQIIRLVNTAYFVAKYEKPLTDYPRLILLHEVNGLDMGNFYTVGLIMHVGGTKHLTICCSIFHNHSSSLSKARPL